MKNKFVDVTEKRNKKPDAWIKSDYKKIKECGDGQFHVTDFVSVDDFIQGDEVRIIKILADGIEVICPATVEDGLFSRFSCEGNRIYDRCRKECIDVLGIYANDRMK